MFLVRREGRCDESMAFPSSRRAAVREALASVAVGEWRPPRDAFMVNVDGETLHLPYRVYYEPGLLRREISNAQPGIRRILLCLGTRHYSGYLRQACLRELLRDEAPWLTPYIVQLAGEYVIEIVQDVANAIAGRNAAALQAFVVENPAYLRTLERRVTSYWSCYHRRAYPKLDSYPGAQVMAALRMEQRPPLP